ncbi:ABC transporter permease [uncultured Streptomyces sp.]|uniref:ABC transporter permease n=1 Tax=uncultured Streptomyces sp. TaxID=174707 RepID=UPI002622383D|nr:ABC transporter permease [uncultured Streptomyces sp.]
MSDDGGAREDPRPDGTAPDGAASDGAARTGAAHGSHARPRTGRDRWEEFKKSPFLPATVLVFILAAAAGMFAGSYTYTMANPTPRHVPAALIGEAQSPRGAAFVAGMEKALDASLVLHTYDTEAGARGAMADQRVFTAIRAGNDRTTVLVAGAAGASVAQLIEESAAAVGKQLGMAVTVTDINPLQEGDPRGLALFYISLAAVIIGFVGAIQLSVHARALNPLERIAYTAAYALLGGFVIAAVVDWLLGALHLPSFTQSWMILAFTMFTSGMVFTMFNTLMGRWAMLPTWGVMVLLGNPSSGGAVSWPLLPSVLGHIGRWLPPGASVNAQHTAVYYQGHQFVFPYLVMAGWALVSCAVFWIWRHRHPGGRARVPEHAAAAG